jgi:ATP-dependent exoDNAse (exonuclease V) beta subunit
MIRIFSFSVHNPFLMKLLDETETFVLRHTGTIPLFLDWWEEEGHKKTLSTPPGIDAITISTIHKAKGLEYPVVVLPFSRFSYALTKPNIFVQDHVTGLEYDWVSLKKEGMPERYQSIYEEEHKKTQIDQLNKLYVAHTRAGKELHIITEKKRSGNYSKFLAEFCEKKGIKGEKEKAESRKQKAESRKQKGESRSAFVPSCLRAFVPFSPLTAYRLPLTASQIRGIYIHSFLSSLTVFPQTETEIEEVVKDVEETYKEDIANIFHKILNNPQLQPYFAPEVKALNETSILFPNGNLLRPDRVVFLQGRVVVIDYKTGEPTASHKEQIDQYCEAIREMGYEEVEGRVLYI